MAQRKEPDPLHRRAGLLSVLAKLNINGRKQIMDDATVDEAIELQCKLSERYPLYLESHDIALAANPDRKEALARAHNNNEKRHEKFVYEVELYIADGTKPEGSMHCSSMHSGVSQREAKSAMEFELESRASRLSHARSERLSETRVQAELASTQLRQLRAVHAKQQQKLELERAAARHKLKLDEESR